MEHAQESPLYPIIWNEVPFTSSLGVQTWNFHLASYPPWISPVDTFFFGGFLSKDWAIHDMVGPGYDQGWDGDSIRNKWGFFTWTIWIYPSYL